MIDRFLPNLLKTLDAMNQELQKVQQGMLEVTAEIGGFRADLRIGAAIVAVAAVLFFIFRRSKS